MINGIDGQRFVYGLELDFEDCTEQSLGMVPQDDKWKDESESGDETSSDIDYDDYDDDSESGEEEHEWGRSTMELTRLLEECDE